MKEILIDEFSRYRLVRFLEGKSRPPKIDAETWHNLISAELCAASFGTIGHLCDHFGVQVLEVLRVDEKKVYG